MHECKNFCYIGALDVAPALDSIRAEHWHADTYLRDFPQGPFSQCDSVILRFPPRSVHETRELLDQHLAGFDEHECVWLPVALALPLIERIVFDLARSVQATRIGRVMVNRLQPGGRIYPHADTPSHANYWSRFHVVLRSLPGNRFRCGDEVQEFLTGDIFYFDNRLEHEVQNNSVEPRVHLVIDLKTSLR